MQQPQWQPPAPLLTPLQAAQSSTAGLSSPPRATSFAPYAAAASAYAAHAAVSASASSYSAPPPPLRIEVAPLYPALQPLSSAPAASSSSAFSSFQLPPPPRSVYRGGHDSSSSSEGDGGEGEDEDLLDEEQEIDDPRALYKALAIASSAAARASAAASASGADGGRPPRAPRSRAVTSFSRGLHRVLDALPRVLDVLMRGLGPALVFGAWCIFGGVSYVYFHCILPAHELHPGSGRGLPITVFALSLLFQVYYNHVMATFTPPGGVPSDWVSAAQQRVAGGAECSADAVTRSVQRPERANDSMADG